VNAAAGEILVVLVRSATSSPALEKAARLAERSGLGLRLFCCDSDPRLVARLFLRPESLSAARADFLRGCRKWLAGQAEPLLRRGLKVDIEAAWDAPLHAGIMREVALSRPLLVVKDMQWHAPLGRGLLTGTDWHLLRTCPVPLLLAKPRAWAEAPRVAAAVDPGHPADPESRLDHRIVRETGRLAAWLQAELRIVHACLSPGPSLELGEHGLRDAAAAAVGTVCEQHQVDRDCITLLEGAAVDVIPGFCEEQAVDVLGVGAASRSRMYEAVIGSTAEMLVDRIPSDLLVIGFHRAD